VLFFFEKEHGKKMEYLEGIVLYGINNIYTVLVSGKELQCRIKGKVLEEEEQYYNPIAAGDYVSIMEDPFSNSMGWIVERKERKNGFYRWNRKKKVPQVIAANVDLVMAICSDRAPPFRPRFLDRMIVSAQSEGIEVIILANKCDLRFTKKTKERLVEYRKIGYRVIYCSAKTGEGINEIKAAIRGKISVFAGQSGVGKSSLLNRIEPGLDLKIGDISSKYNRGIHTTKFSVMLILSTGQRVIDTPGLREFFIHDITSDELKYYFPEFRIPSEKCGYSSCLHVAEPDCMVREYVKQGKIHGDRYKSYIRIFESLTERERELIG
jgi:ribosome biogenesis GTPase